MTVIDSLLMALHNLWARKTRTLLNLLGVVLSCVMLTMTLAGTRGASEGLLDIINASDQTKSFMIIGAPNQHAEVPEDAIVVPDGVSDKRRPRIVDRLRKDWINKNAKRIRMDAEVMAQLRAIPNMQSVVAQTPLRCQFEWQVPDASESSAEGTLAKTKAAKPRSIPGSLIGIRNDDPRLPGRLVVGTIPTANDTEGVMVDEFTAYKLGYQADDQLEGLLGQEITIRSQLAKGSGRPVSATARAVNALGGMAAVLDEELIASMRRAAKQLDQTDLSDSDKATIRQMLKQFPEDQPTEKAPADSRGAADSPKNKNVLDDEEVGPNGARTVVRKVVVRGVLKHPEKDADLFSFLQFTGVGSRANVYINHETTESISMRRKGFGGFWTVAGSVDEVADLRGVIDEVEATGLRTRSAVTIVEKLAKEVGKLKLAAGALAMVILFVAAIGICNTMIIAVLERTPEFGIMKSLGAEDRQVLNLVLLEGLLTGLLGAAVAMLVSYGLASGMSEILRGWIEERLKGSFDQPVFRFSVLDAAIVFAITATVCTLASLFPAWRAAKLDPITAMRRT